jgi:tRNA (uracil-5-)-methyltransferase TRM9
MDTSALETLISLNRQFYQTFALEFSATRMRLQPGIWRLLDRIPEQSFILDLGCGNGELARELARRGHQGGYVGLDYSSRLLSEAGVSLSKETVKGNENRFQFIQADLSTPDWDEGVRSLLNDYPAYHFDFVLAFAVLHHIPGENLRRQILHKVHALLSNRGHFIHSEWQFLNSPRLRARLQPWEKAGLKAADVDPGDYLLDWRQGGYGLRYVHHFEQNELSVLAEETGFAILETFSSDGEGGNLGLYQVWEVDGGPG